MKLPYAILKFDFSRIDTATPESTFKGFLANVKSAARIFLHTTVRAYVVVFVGERAEVVEEIV